MYRYTLLAHKVDGLFLIAIAVVLGLLNLAIAQHFELIGKTDKVAIFMPITKPRAPKRLLTTLRADPRVLSLEHLVKSQGLLSEEEAQSVGDLLANLQDGAKIPDTIIFQAQTKDLASLGRIVQDHNLSFHRIYQAHRGLAMTCYGLALGAVCLVFFHLKSKRLQQCQQALVGLPDISTKLYVSAVIYGCVFWTMATVAQALVVVLLQDAYVDVLSTLIHSVSLTLPLIILTIFLINRIIYSTSFRFV